MKEFVRGGNPYLPVWEHIPDGEPRVFTYNGETRVYVYGSHDSLRSEYCGEDYVVWSAPVDDLNNWRFDGEIFRAEKGNALYAPDVVKKGDTYYLYVAMHRGSEIWVAEAKSPVGPFRNPRKTEFGFDVGVLVDDDGRCYAYWGFCKCFGCEINEDMATIKEGTLRENMIPHCKWAGHEDDSEYMDSEFSYFEAASIRKVEGKYVFIYSKWDNEGDKELYRKPEMNAYLDYAYSDSPLDGWVHGGTISNNTGEVIHLGEDFKRAYVRCNNHGSICQISGQWYVFYHHRTGTNEYARQGMLEPIEVAMGKDGRLFIGDITYDENGDPIASNEVEMTSQGAYRNGLPAEKIISAGRTVYIDGEDESDMAYVLSVYDPNNVSDPVVNIKGRTVIGFKYVDFGQGGWSKVVVRGKAQGEQMQFTVHLDSPSNEAVARGMIGKDCDYQVAEAVLNREIQGRHGVYFTFTTEKGSGAFDWFTFL